MLMSLIAAALWSKTCKQKKKTAICRKSVTFSFFFCRHYTKLLTLCSTVVAMWNRVVQSQGVHITMNAVPTENDPQQRKTS